MDHLGDWALPGAALVFVVIAGIVMFALDDIIGAVLVSWRGKTPAESQAPADAADERAGGRKRRLKARAKRAWQRVATSRRIGQPSRWRRQ